MTSKQDHDLLTGMDVKLDGIDRRLATMNGSLLRHQEQIHDNEVAIAKVKTRLDERTQPSWKPQTRKGWFTGGTLLLAFMTLAATFAAKLIEILPWG